MKVFQLPLGLLVVFGLSVAPAFAMETEEEVFAFTPMEVTILYEESYQNQFCSDGEALFSNGITSHTSIYFSGGDATVDTYHSLDSDPSWNDPRGRGGYPVIELGSDALIPEGPWVEQTSRTQQFEAVIPEPAAAGWVVGGAAFCLLVFRRRRAARRKSR